MLQLAILDDNSDTLIDYEINISAWFKKHNIDGGITLLTTNSNELMTELDCNTINVCIIDINLRDDINGMSIAEQIRKKSFEVEIIFVTGCLEYIQRAFDVRAYQFIPKPGWDKLEITLYRLSKEKETHRQKYFQLSHKKEICFIPVDTVLFLESLDRKTIIHTIKNSEHKDYETYVSLEKLVNSVKEGSLRRAYRSIYVNPDKIESIDRVIKIIKFKDGSTCNVSANYISNFVFEERQREKWI